MRISTAICGNCGEDLWENSEGQLVHVEPRDTEFPEQCDPALVRK